MSIASGQSHALGRSSHFLPCIAYREDFPDVPIAIGPVEISPPQPGVEFHIVRPHGRAAVDDIDLPHSIKNAIEFNITYVEAVVVAGKRIALGKVQGQGIVHIDRGEVPPSRLPRDAQQVGKGLGIVNGVVRRNDQMVQLNRHCTPPDFGPRGCVYAQPHKML